MIGTRRSLACIVLTTFLLYSLIASAVTPNIEAAPVASEIVLSIDYENGTISEYSNLNGTTVLNITQTVADVDIQWAGNLAFVIAIDGVSQDHSHFWQYWVNGEYGSIAANWYQLSEGDIVEWKRTSSVYSNTETQDPDYSLVIGSIAIIIGGIGFLLILYRKTSRRG